MQFAHILRKERDEMVQVNATRFATEKRVFFAVYKAEFEEICETTLAFKCSVVHEYEKSKTVEGKEISSSSSEDEEQQDSVVDPFFYLRKLRTNGNCYHLVVSFVLKFSFKILLEPTSYNNLSRNIRTY